MKACTLIATVVATAALAVPVAQAAGRNGLQCAGSATRTDNSFSNHRALQSSSSCTSASKRAHISAASVASVTGARLGTDAGQAQQRAMAGFVISMTGAQLGSDAGQTQQRAAKAGSGPLLETVDTPPGLGSVDLRP